MNEVPNQPSIMPATEEQPKNTPEVSKELIALESEIPTGRSIETNSEPVGATTDVNDETNAASDVVVAPRDQEPVDTLPIVAGVNHVKSEVNAGGKKLTKKRTIVLASIGAVLVGGAVLAGVLFTGLGKSGDAIDSKTTATQTVKAGSVMGVAATVTDGTVTYLRGNGEWKPLTSETQLKEGDSVKTAAESRVVLTFDDGSALRLDASSSVQLTSLKADNVEVKQLEGTAYSRVVPSDRSYKVTIGTTSYTAMGTAFATTSTSGEKGVRVFQSSVKVNGVDAAVKEGEQYYRENSDSLKKEKITTIDLDALTANEFFAWNTAEDEKDTQFKEKLGVLAQIKLLREQKAKLAEAARTQPTQPVAAQAGIVLAATADAKGANISWTLSGVTAPNGFKVVRSSSSSTPTYGKDDAVYVSDAAARSYLWKADKAGSYWFRVCTYQPEQSTCNNYSNAVQLTLTASTSDDNKPAEKVTRGTITLSVNEAGKASWSYTGNALYGYKLVASKTQSPVYPDNSVGYFEAGKTVGYLSLSQKGTYYVRVCAWTNGSESSQCLDYSNQVVYIKN